MTNFTTTESASGIRSRLVQRLITPGLLRQENFVGGEWLPSSSGARHAVVDPSVLLTLTDLPGQR
jgi:hypothetical protein